MAIHVVCECGARREVPDKWRGKRVKCQCGRRFSVGGETENPEPAVSPPPVTPSNSPPESVPPSEVSDGEPVAPAPPPPDQNGSSTDTRETVVARYRARQRAANRGKRLAVGLGVLLLLLFCGGGFFFMSRNAFLGPRQADEKKHHQSVRKQVRERPGLSKTSDDHGATQQGKRAERDPISSLEHEPGSPTDSLGGPTELKPDDGLLLVDGLEQISERLELSKDQLAKIESLTAQFEEKSEALEKGELALETWFMEAEDMGTELLGMLTEPQRDTLRELIQKEAVERMSLEKHAARLRPELETPSVPWEVEPDGTDWPVLQSCSLSEPANGHCLRTTAPSGAIAFATKESDGLAYTVWNFVDDQRVGSREVPLPGSEGRNILSRDGRFIVRGSVHNGAYQVRSWPVNFDSPPKTKSIQTPSLDSSAGRCQLVDCIDGRVLCVFDGGFWVWDLQSDETWRHHFSDWAPPGLPSCTVSPGGRYAAMAHRHHIATETKNYHFLEVALYELDTGQLVGNKVLAMDYQPFHVTALAFSHDGRELALLWDSDTPRSERHLIHMSALNGTLIRKHRGLPVAENGDAAWQELRHRKLIWLPKETGWVVELKNLVDTQSEVVIELKLPRQQLNGPNNESTSRTIVEALPAANNRLLLITVGPSSSDPAVNRIDSEFVELPEISPFL